MWDYVISILGASWFQTLVAILAAITFIIKKWLNNREDIRNVSSMIVIEINQIDSTMDDLRRQMQDKKQLISFDKKMMNSNTWKANKYKYVKRLTTEEWKIIDDFYSDAIFLDENLERYKNMFYYDTEQIRYNKQRMYAELSKEQLDDFRDKMEKVGKNNKGDEVELPKDKVDNLTESGISLLRTNKKFFDMLYADDQDNFSYIPNKLNWDIEKYINVSPKGITGSTAFSKINKLARKRLI
jgi:hypothetical protein